MVEHGGFWFSRYIPLNILKPVDHISNKIFADLHHITYTYSTTFMHSNFSNRFQFVDHSKHKTTIKNIQQQSKAIETNEQKIKNNQTQSKTINQNNQTKSKTINHKQKQSTNIQKQSFAFNQQSKAIKHNHTQSIKHQRHYKNHQKRITAINQNKKTSNQKRQHTNQS